jgi:hypothetical protein
VVFTAAGCCSGVTGAGRGRAGVVFLGDSLVEYYKGALPWGRIGSIPTPSPPTVFLALCFPLFAPLETQPSIAVSLTLQDNMVPCSPIQSYTVQH